MVSRHIMVIICLLLSCAGTAFAQTSQNPVAPEEDIIKALGTIKLEDLKKAVPSGIETRITPESGSRLSQVKAVTRFTDPGGHAVYYFNQARHF